MLALLDIGTTQITVVIIKIIVKNYKIIFLKQFISKGIKNGVITHVIDLKKCLKKIMYIIFFFLL